MKTQKPSKKARENVLNLPAVADLLTQQILLGRFPRNRVPDWLSPADWTRPKEAIKRRALDLGSPDHKSWATEQRKQRNAAAWERVQKLKTRKMFHQLENLGFRQE